jgi:hypothetical protein
MQKSNAFKIVLICLSAVLLTGLIVTIVMWQKAAGEKEWMRDQANLFAQKVTGEIGGMQQTSAQSTVYIQTSQAQATSVMGTMTAVVGSSESYRRTQAASSSSISKTQEYIRELTYCGERRSFRPSYDNNIAMSIALKKWVASVSSEDEYGLTDSWTLFYENSRLTRHMLLGTYRWDFLVFFPEERMQYQGVFWIGGQCWLDVKEIK